MGGQGPTRGCFGCRAQVARGSHGERRWWRSGWRESGPGQCLDGIGEQAGEGGRIIAGTCSVSACLPGQLRRSLSAARARSPLSITDATWSRGACVFRGWFGARTQGGTLFKYFSATLSVRIERGRVSGCSSLERSCVCAWPGVDPIPSASSSGGAELDRRVGSALAAAHLRSTG